MPYCRSCGTKVGSEARFCTNCGTPFSEPTATNGFLSAESIAYIQAVVDEERRLDPNEAEYHRLASEVTAAFVDFGMLGLLGEEFSLFELLGGASPTGHQDTVTTVAAYSGFIRLPELYDQALGTTWSRDIDEWVSATLEASASETESKN